MKQIFFSIVIPTYNDSSKFIGPTIETCLEQNYKNYEVIVYQDKVEQNVKDKIKSYENVKLSFYSGDERLSITKNWEKAISFARGDYIIFLGHDDGLLQHALRDLNKIINKFKFKLIRYERLNLNLGYYGTKSYFEIPLIRGNHIKNGKKIIKEVINFKKNYTELPMLYNSAVSKELIQKLKSVSGNVFDSKNPDIYSGISLAYISNKFFSVGRPMIVNTGSSNSVGMLMSKFEKNQSVDKKKLKDEYIGLFKKDKINNHNLVPDFGTIHNKVLDSFMIAKDNFIITDKKIDFDKKRFIEKVIKFKQKREDTNWILVFDEINKFISSEPYLKKWFKKKFKIIYLSFLKNKNKKFGLTHDKTFLNINPDQFNISNSLEAAKFYENLLNYKNNELKLNSFADNIVSKLRIIYRILFK